MTDKQGASQQDHFPVAVGITVSNGEREKGGGAAGEAGLSGPW